jgi:hypothetical protein
VEFALRHGHEFLDRSDALEQIRQRRLQRGVDRLGEKRLQE